jgi:hypothetical protein
MNHRKTIREDRQQRVEEAHRHDFERREQQEQLTSTEKTMAALDPNGDRTTP